MSPELTAFFATPAHAAAFALMHMEGTPKMELLGIGRAHYRDRQEADTFLRHMEALLAEMPQALAEARTLHAEMIG